MNLPLFILDTFTSTRFKGNPAAVCCLEEPVGHLNMLAVAKELNLPVTAFITKRQGSIGNYSIQYFTPVTEISACGHATLGATAVVSERDNIPTAVFHTMNGVSIATSVENGLISMAYLRYGISQAVVDFEMLNSLHIDNYKSAGYCNELETLFIELESPALLRGISPDYNKLLTSSHVIKEVVITSVSDNDEYDFLLRSFCPWIGIDEDPATGSVHSVLAGFWSERLNKNKLKAFQASERGGEVIVTNDNDTVQIAGRCVNVVKGVLTI